MYKWNASLSTIGLGAVSESTTVGIRLVLVATTMLLGSFTMIAVRARGYSRNATALSASVMAVLFLVLGLAWSARLDHHSRIAFQKGHIDEFWKTAWLQQALCSGLNLGAVALATLVTVLAIRWRLSWRWVATAVISITWLVIAPAFLWSDIPRMF